MLGVLVSINLGQAGVGCVVVWDERLTISSSFWSTSVTSCCQPVEDRRGGRAFRCLWHCRLYSVPITLIAIRMWRTSIR
jgi:hypothetical protein